MIAKLEKSAVDYYTTAYRRSEADVAYGGATWRVMFVHINNYRPIEWCTASRQLALLCPHLGIAIADRDTFGRG